MYGFEQRNNDTYTVYWEQIIKELNKAVDSTFFGNETSKFIGFFRIDLLYMQLHSEQRRTDEESKLECISRKMFCEGIDTRFLEEIFTPLYLESGNGDEGGESGSDDGINFMQVEGDGTDHPINRIR